MSTLKVNTIQDTSGKPQYTAKVWGNINFTGTPSIRASGNLSSITDHAVGEFTLNFSNALADANYTFAFGADDGGYNDNAAYHAKGVTWSSTSLRILCAYAWHANGRTDFEIGTFVIFR